VGFISVARLRTAFPFPGRHFQSTCHGSAGSVPDGMRWRIEIA
jgi:hypothetical protein